MKFTNLFAACCTTLALVQAAPAMIDVISGKITCMFDITSTAIPFIKSGKARALAVTSKERNPELPDVPTMIESGLKDYEVVGWYALMAPPHLPADIDKRLTKALRDVENDPGFKKAMVDGGYTMDNGDGKALQGHIEREYDLWSKVVEAAHITAN